MHALAVCLYGVTHLLLQTSRQRCGDAVMLAMPGNVSIKSPVLGCTSAAPPTCSSRDIDLHPLILSAVNALAAGVRADHGAGGQRLKPEIFHCFIFCFLPEFFRVVSAVGVRPNDDAGGQRPGLRVPAGGRRNRFLHPLLQAGHPGHGDLPGGHRRLDCGCRGGCCRPETLNHDEFLEWSHDGVVGGTANTAAVASALKP